MMFNFWKIEFLKNVRNEKIKKYNFEKSQKNNYFIESKRSGTFPDVESSTSSPGGNQVDGLPPVSSICAFGLSFFGSKNKETLFSIVKTYNS